MKTRVGQDKGGRVAVILTPEGVSTISFLGSERESLSFLNLIKSELDQFGQRVRELSERSGDEEH